MRIPILCIVLFYLISCNGQKQENNTAFSPIDLEEFQQIGQYVTFVSQDKTGHYWMGTIENGMARYDGKNLIFFDKEYGMPSNRVIGMIQDSLDNYWFETDMGLVKYDGQTIQNFIVSQDNERANNISYSLIDSKNRFWVGTWNGVYLFDGENYTKFHLPKSEEIEVHNPDTRDWITEIKEDKKGNIWISRDGHGIYKYDGKDFHHFTKKDGLNSNGVSEIEFDNDGNIWVGMRKVEYNNESPARPRGKAGANVIRNGAIFDFPDLEPLMSDDSYEIYKDRKGNLWIATTQNGVYRFDGSTFKNYPISISVMDMHEDENGVLWLAGAGGLFKINKNDEIINVTRSGPWE